MANQKTNVHTFAWRGQEGQIPDDDVVKKVMEDLGFIDPKVEDWMICNIDGSKAERLKHRAAYRLIRAAG